MADIQKTVSVIFEGVNNTGAALGGVSKNLDDIGGNAQDATGKVSQLDDEVGSLGSKADNLDKVIAGFKALATAIVVKEFIDANVEAERFDRAMTQIKGSTELAAAEFQYIKDLSNTLGISVGAAADAYVQLSAATKGTALEGQATRDIFEAVSSSMASLGKSTADTQGALLAISQIVSKGTVSMEELRGQLGERLPGAFQVAASSMGRTTQELEKLVASGGLAATDFLPKFAQALKEAYGDVSYVEGFAAAQERLNNSLQELYQTVGESGAMDFLTARVKDVSYVVSVLSLEFKQVSDNISFMWESLKRGNIGDFFSGIGWDNYETQLNKISEKIYGIPIGLNDSEAAAYKFISQFLIGLEKINPDLDKFREKLSKAYQDGTISGEQYLALQGSIGSRAAGDWGKVVDAAERAKTETDSAQNALLANVKNLDAALKTLGIDPKQFKDPIEEILKALNSIANNPALSGEQFLAGFRAALDKITNGPDGVVALGRAEAILNDVIKNNTLNVKEAAQANEWLTLKREGGLPVLDKTKKATDDQSEALKKQAAEAQKAQEAAERMRLEMEKLASNERIAQINAAMGIAVAGIEADAQKAVAAFDSIGKGIESTGKLLEKLYSSYDNYDGMSWQQIRTIQDAIEKESKFREEQFALQKKMTEAQIAEMQARTQSMARGDGLIKIDGAGLQPHLEAFMWEILKTIQVRVNRDGLGLLLGMS